MTFIEDLLDIPMKFIEDRVEDGTIWFIMIGGAALILYFLVFK